MLEEELRFDLFELVEERLFSWHHPRPIGNWKLRIQNVLLWTES